MDEPVPGYGATRRGLHAVAEHVLAAARHRATGRIGLRPTPGGFGTPPFPAGRDDEGAGSRVLRVEGLDLVVVDVEAGRERRAPLRTVGEAAAFAGVEPGAPAGVYTPATPLDPDAPLDLDPAAAALVHDWFARSAAALTAWAGERAADGPTAAQLWPEHFDLALTVGEVNYGASPGDDAHAGPYAYVGPWGRPARGGEYWNEPFGASRPARDLRDPAAIVAFFREGSME
jgi:hypothetical protein